MEVHVVFPSGNLLFTTMTLEEIADHSERWPGTRYYDRDFKLIEWRTRVHVRASTVGDSRPIHRPCQCEWVYPTTGAER